MVTLKQKISDMDRRYKASAGWKKRIKAVIKAGDFKNMSAFCKEVKMQQTHLTRILAKEFPPTDPTIEKVETALTKAEGKRK
jgi:DNA-binding phage protein